MNGNQLLLFFVLIVLQLKLNGLQKKINLQLQVVLVVFLFVILKKIMIGGSVNILKNQFDQLFFQLIGIQITF